MKQGFGFPDEPGQAIRQNQLPLLHTRCYYLNIHNNLQLNIFTAVAFPP